MSEHQYPHHEHDEHGEQREDETMQDDTNRDDTNRDEISRDEISRDEISRDEISRDESLHGETVHDETPYEETPYEETPYEESRDVPVADPGQPLIRYQEPQYGLSDEQVASVTAGQGAWPGAAGPTTGWSGYADYQEEPEPRSGFHQVAVGHLVMGIAFLGLVVIWLLRVTDAVPTEDFRWLMPLPWIAAGGLGLLALALRSGRRDEAY